MAAENWLDTVTVCRKQPRVWVERMWLLESLESQNIIREIGLRQGVNVIWAHEPDDRTLSGQRAAGHGVGKTSFCLLLRHCLCDDAEAINRLREEVATGIPHGGVAAQVHFGSNTWIVFRPFAAHKPSLATPGSRLEDLLSTDASDRFQEYQSSLESTMLATLPIRLLPGSTQRIEWKHLLAWCTRDQRTRFDSFFHWREGEGAGFRRARQDPHLLVKAVLGMMTEDDASLLGEIERLTGELSAAEKRVEELRHEPVYLLHRAERILRATVSADDSLPMHRTDLFEDSVLDRMERFLDEKVRNEGKLGEGLTRQETELQSRLVERQRILNDRKLPELEKRRLAALLENNQEEYQRLNREIDELLRLDGECRYGKILFANCDYIKGRTETIDFLKKRDEKALAEMTRRATEQATQINATLAKLDAEAKPVEASIQTMGSRFQRQRMALVTSQIERQNISRHRDEFLRLENELKQPSEDGELAKALKEVNELSSRKQSAEMRWEIRNQTQSLRAKRLSSLMDALAKEILSETAVGWFDPDADRDPFRLAAGGEAYHVLEVLLGDIGCLVDSISSDVSTFPGFMLHDCPREADMSASLYEHLLRLLPELERYCAASGHVPFQYMLTTTTPPPAELQSEPYICLELRPDVEDGMLFRRRFVSAQAEVL